MSRFLVLDKIDIVENISVVVSIDCRIKKTKQLVRLSKYVKVLNKKEEIYFEITFIEHMYNNETNIYRNMNKLNIYRNMYNKIKYLQMFFYTFITIFAEEN